MPGVDLGHDWQICEVVGDLKLIEHDEEPFAGVAVAPLGGADPDPDLEVVGATTLSGDDADLLVGMAIQDLKAHSRALSVRHKAPGKPVRRALLTPWGAVAYQTRHFRIEGKTQKRFQF